MQKMQKRDAEQSDVFFPHRQGSQELLDLISVSTPSAAFRRSLHHSFSIWKTGIKINHMLI